MIYDNVYADQIAVVSSSYKKHKCINKNINAQTNIKMRFSLSFKLRNYI